MQEATVQTVFIFYVLFFPGTDVDEAALFKKHAGDLKVLVSTEDGAKEPGVILKSESVKDRPLPDAKSLPYFSRGFSQEAADKLAKCKTAITIVGIGPFDPDHKLLKELTLTVSKMAAETDAFIHDGADSMTFTRDAFQKIRVDEIQRGELSPNQFGVRAYRTEEGLRSVTMGLEKFGQTNICIASFPEHLMGGVDALTTLAIQEVIESKTQIKPGDLLLDTQKIKNPTVKARYAKVNAAGGTGKATLKLVPIDSIGGDPKKLLGPKFASPPGDDLWNEQAKLLESIFGKSRDVSEGVSMEELEEAIAKVRVDVAAILKNEKKWKAPGRKLKLAVELPTVKEVVWVEVQSWDGKKGKGILLSKPIHVDLESGSTFEFTTDVLMDYRLSDAEKLLKSGGIDEMVKKLQSAK